MSDITIKFSIGTQNLRLPLRAFCFKREHCLLHILKTRRWKHLTWTEKCLAEENLKVTILRISYLEMFSNLPRRGSSVSSGLKVPQWTSRNVFSNEHYLALNNQNILIISYFCSDIYFKCHTAKDLNSVVQVWNTQMFPCYYFNWNSQL